MSTRKKSLDDGVSKVMSSKVMLWYPTEKIAVKIRRKLSIVYPFLQYYVESHVAAFLYFAVKSPLEQFEVVPLVSLSAPVVGDFILSLTNIGFYCFITVGLVIGLHVIGSNGHRLVPSRWSVALESAYASVHGIVRDQIGSTHEIYTPFIYALFWFILIANLNGNIPYCYTVTTSGIAAIGLSVLIFLAVTILALNIHGLHFFSFFVPGGTPLSLAPMLVLIEWVSYIARAVSLGIRAFANIVAGHSLQQILSTFLGQLFGSGFLVGVLTIIPFAVFIALIGLELAVSFIQAYVFCVLSSAYLKDAIELH